MMSGISQLLMWWKFSLRVQHQGNIGVNWGKVKDREFDKLQFSPIWVQLKLPFSDGKHYMTDCAHTKNMFRIIQSIPSKKAEPFKQWLAQVGYERIEEIENPENCLAFLLQADRA